MEVFSYLSNPFEGDFAALAAELAATQFRAFCKRALRIAEQVGYGADPLVADIVDRLGQRDATVAYWTPEVGIIFTGLDVESPAGHDYQWLRAQIALGAHVTGLTTDIEIDVESATPLLVCGRTIPPGRWAVRGDAERMTIEPRDPAGAEATSAPGSFSVHGYRGGSPVWAEDTKEPLFVDIDGQPAIRLVGDDWHAVWADERIELAEQNRSMIARVHESLSLLERSMPEYRDWILCLLKEITPIRRPGEHMIASNSSALRLGGIDIATPASPTETLEMLVHECSHQYLHMASWIGSIVTPDAKLHYSPLKRRERPLDKILLGYHAFGNVLMVYDRLRAGGFAAEIADRLSTVTAYMDELRKPLESEEGISELGLWLYRPLRDRLASSA